TGSTWRDAVLSGGRIGSGVTDTFQPVRASKIRMLVTAATANAGGDSPSIAEFEVFNVSGADVPPIDDPAPSPPTLPDPPASASGNFAALPGTVVTASSQWSDEYGARQAADGSAATRWNSANSMGGEWLQIDFG